MVKNFYQPDPGPDWTKKLNEIYARQTRQRNEHHANLLQQSAELEKADPGVANLALFKQILDTTATGVQVYNKYKTKQEEKKEAEIKTEWQDKSGAEQKAIELAFDEDLDDIKRGDKEGEETLLKEIKARWGDDIAPEDVQAIMDEYYDREGQKIVKFEQLVLNNLVTKSGEAEFKKNRMGTKRIVNGKEIGTEWDYLQSDAGKGEFDSQMQQWLRKKIGDEAGNVSDKLVNKTIRELNRKTETASKTNKNVAATTTNELRAAQKLAYLSSTNLTTTSKEKAQHLVKIITEGRHKYVKLADGTTPLQQSVEETVGNLVIMGDTKQLDRNTWNEIRNGLIEHPAGKNFSQAFDKDGIFDTAVINSIERGEKLDYEARQTIVEGDYQNTFVAAAEGKLSLEDYKAKVSFFKRMPLKDDKAKLERLDRVFHTNQDQVTTDDILNNWSSNIANGTLGKHKDAIKDIGNINAQNELNKIEQYQTKAANDAKLDEKLQAIKTTVIGERAKGIFGTPGGTQKTQRVYEDIQQNYRLLFFKNLEDAKALSQGGPVDIKAITMKTDSEIETYKVSNGFGIPLGKEGSGKFSVKGTSGEYDNYTKSIIGIQTSDAFTSQTLSYSKTNVENWENGIHSRKQSQPNSALRHKEPGGIFTNEMLAYYAVNQKPSEEMLYIAGRESLNISRALGYSINALVDSNDPDDKRFVKDYNLDKIETANMPDEILLKAGYEAVTKLDGKEQNDLNNLLARTKRNGIDSLNGVEIERLLTYTETFQQSEAASQTTNLLNNIDMFKRAGISEDAIKEWIQEEIDKRKSFSNTITAN